MTQPAKNPARRAAARKKQSPLETGAPDPRPVTTFEVSVEDANNVLISLHQPCVVREPRWGFVDSVTGSAIYPESVEVLDPTKFRFTFGETVKDTIGWVDVPYMDTNVQNYAGGFVKPGGTWFREAA